MHQITIANNKQLNVVKNISYGAPLAHVLLWQKAFLLTPIWAIATVPIFGFLCRSMGNTVMQAGYGVVICLFVAYFCEDLLKRRIRLDDDYLYFGFRSILIRNLINIDIKYKKSKFLPGQLILTELSGKNLKLSLNGLTDESVEVLLKHLQSRNSTLSVAPVLTSMIKCRRVKPIALQTSERLEIPYQSRRLIGESVDAYKATAGRWMRVGPILACILFSPMWIGWLSILYISLQPGAQFRLDNLSLHSFLTSIAVGLSSWIAVSGAATVGVMQDAVKNSWVGILLGISITTLWLYLVRSIWKPNAVVADPRGIHLSMRVGGMCLPIANINWSAIKKVSMQSVGGRQSKLKIEKENGKGLVMELASITPEDRNLLLRRMEKMVPDCSIDHELSQSMRPQSEHSYTEIWLQSLSESPERKTLEPLAPGQLVGDTRFEVLRSLGVGGQGTAYLCRQSINVDLKPVVLKETILPIFVDSTLRRKALESFDQEAKLLQSLEHPGIVKLSDYFVEDHRAYLVMEHVDGLSIRDLIVTDGPMPEQKVRDLAFQMCEILKFMHEHKVVHRDFTPDNLILNSEGKVKLIDFNVAQQIQGGATGSIVGKHAYLPPEQFRGKATTQSDLYAFGATLFYMLIGTDPEPISQSSPLSQNAEISVGLDQIVRRATTLQTNNRYQTAQDIVSDLATIPDATTSLFKANEMEVAHG
jgi:serine/threonine protein kinase